MTKVLGSADAPLSLLLVVAGIGRKGRRCGRTGIWTRAAAGAPPQLGIFGDDAGPVPWVSGFSACFALAAERSKPYVHAMMIDTEQTAERRRARLLSTHRAIGEGRGRPIGHAVADGRDDGQCRE
jgi:hypothetical protein